MYLTKQLIEKWEARAATYDEVPDELARCIREAKVAVAKAQELNWTAKTLDTIIHLKKHKGKTLKEVIEQDPQYVNWMCRDIVGFYLDETAHHYLIENGG